MEPVREFPESMKLEGVSNYSTWSFKMEQILIRSRLWRFVNLVGASVLTYLAPPVATTSARRMSTAASGTSEVDKTGDNEDTGDQGKKTVPDDSSKETNEGASSRQTSRHTKLTKPDDEEMKALALSTIKLSVRDSVIHHVRGYTDPVVLWKRLKDLYEFDSTTRRRMLKQKFFAARLTDDKPIEQSMTQITNLVDQLVGIGVHISDQELVDLTLSALPRSWNVFRTMISRQEHIPSFAVLKDMILQEDVSTQAETEQEAEDEALFTSVPAWRRNSN